jgi:fatty-acyl-CoA synthase
MAVPREETQAKLDRLSAGALQHTPEQTYTVADRFEERAAQSPDHTFLIFEDERISFSELNRQANRFAHLALAKGLKKGDVAAVMLENRPEFFFAWVGLAKLGVITALINTHARGRALDHALTTTQSQFLLIGSECLEQFRSGGDATRRAGALVVPDPAQSEGLAAIPSDAEEIGAELAKASDSNPDRKLRGGLIAEEPLFYVFTSGTTGLPKAAVLSHMRWLGVGDGWKNLIGINEEDVFYCVLPLFHVAAGMSLVSSALAAGASILLRRRFSASRFWDDVRKYGVTTTQYIGEICRYLIAQPRREDDGRNPLRRMTGAGLRGDIWEEFQERFAVEEIIEGFGGSETNCNLVNVDNKPGSCGRIPFKDRSNARLVKYDLENECHVTNPDGTLLECGPEEIGELIGMIVNIPGVGAGRFEGYTDPEATEKKILRDVLQKGDAWFRTGDLFRRDEDDYYYFVDRIGDTFRWKSENVSTMEVAEALADLPGLHLINVYGVEVPGQEGRAGMAALVMNEGKSFAPKAFYQRATERLPSYAAPLFVRISSEADITATFRLRKVALRNAGYDPGNFPDPLYVRDDSSQTYLPYSEEALARLGIPPFQSPGAR